ncbi:hypothetical protein ACTXT7_016277 [Hymenolepis weldensis]
MLSSVSIAYFVGFWAFAYLMDLGLSTHPYTRQKYVGLRDRAGFSINILQAKFFTQKLNPFFERICEVNWFPWSLWFFAGTAFSAVFMLLSIVVLFFLAYNTILRKPIEKQVITPVMPGVNLPVNQLGFYLLTLLVCVVLHEAGHAMAALRERVRIHGFGFFLLGIYPGAYVDISDTDLNSLSPMRQLKIYSAGVWHNGVIVILSILCFYGLPWILSPAYVVNQGVGIIDLQQNDLHLPTMAARKIFLLTSTLKNLILTWKLIAVPPAHLLKTGILHATNDQERRKIDADVKGDFKYGAVGHSHHLMCIDEHWARDLLLDKRVPGHSTSGMEKNSVFSGPRGLQLGDAITRVNTCPVTTPAEWYHCLQEASAKPTGYCVPSSFITQHLSLQAASVVSGGDQPGVRHLSAVVPQAQQQPEQKNQNADLKQQQQFVNGSGADCCPPHLAPTHICFTHMASGINTKYPLINFTLTPLTSNQSSNLFYTSYLCNE